MSSSEFTDPALAIHGMDLDEYYTIPVLSSTAGDEAREDVYDKYKSILNVGSTGQFSQTHVDDMRKVAFGKGLEGRGRALDMYSVPPPDQLASTSNYTVPMQYSTVTVKPGTPLKEDVWEQGKVTIVNLGERADGSTSYAQYERSPGSHGISFGSTNTNTWTTSREFGGEELPIPGKSIWPNTVGEAYSATTDISRTARRSAEQLAIETFVPQSSGDGSYRH